MRVVLTAAAVLAAGAGYEQVGALTQQVDLRSGGSRFKKGPSARLPMSRASSTCPFTWRRPRLAGRRPLDNRGRRPMKPQTRTHPNAQ